MTSKKILILNGSPRRKGTSYSFARTIKMLTEVESNRAEIIHIIEYLEGEKSIENLRTLLGESDILCLSSPLYVDSLPYPVIWFFEKLVEDFKGEIKNKSFFAIGQCAFPYSVLLDTLLNCCRCFADEAGMKWLGGLGYGGGVMINGAHLEQIGKKGEKITLAFRLALEDVLQNNEISSKPKELLYVDLPRVLSRPMAFMLNQMAKSNAKKYGLSIEALKRKAYLD
jgi:multimeric flavodoxin WrbA